MVSIEISPGLLAKLLMGDSLVFRFEGTDFEMFLSDGAYKDGRVGAAVLQVLPFIGDKH
jgi:hypothetical protein